MWNARLRTTSYCALLLAAACGQDELASPLSPPGGRPALTGPAMSGFYWLPPMVKDPGPFTGAFDGGRSPVVRILCTGASAPGCPEVARFDGTSAGSTQVTVDLVEEAYRSNWHTPATLELGAGKYRLEVSENGGVLGQAELRVVAAPRDVKAVPAGEIALVRGQPFLIKFRIETGADPDPLPVAASTPIGQAIPNLVFTPQPGDYQTGHPEMPDQPVSPSVLTLSLQATATAGEVNALLKPLGVRVVGGMPSASPVTGGFLILRLPTSTHAAMETALAILRASPLVRAAFQNHLLGEATLPLRSSFTGDWAWEVSPLGGNWALELARVPQLWAWNERVAASAAHTTVLVFDRHFWPNHEDLTFDSFLTPDSLIVFPGLADDDYHGTMVASVLGAGFGNGRGLDGVDPRARLYAAHRADDATEGLRQLRDILLSYPSIRVVNQSFGIDWVAPGGSLRATRAAITSLADESGEAYRDMLLDLQSWSRPLPYIVQSAGNDGAFNLHARDNGWAANAAIVLGTAPVIVVEGLEQNGTSVDLGTYSNDNGQVSAGGRNVTVATGQNQYAPTTGTSFSTPLVAGIVSYLLALDPTLPDPTMTGNPIRDLMISTGGAATAASPVVDAFALVLALDQRNNSQAFARALTDVDDGTDDGNERVRPDGTPNTSTASAGDGVVDMRDFRRFRDWYLQATGAGSHLNGAPDHPKKDLNGDGVVEATSAAENVYPRGDFNGDGVIDDTPRPFGKSGPSRTDLEVLAQHFGDPDYQATELSNLLHSGDLRVDPAACTAATGAVQVRTTVEIVGAGPVKAITHGSPSQASVITVAGLGAATPYRVIVAGTGTNASVVFADTTSGVVVDPGSDEVIAPTCACPATTAPALGRPALSSANCSTLSVTPSSTTVARGGTRQFAAYLDGALTSAVTWTASRGTITGAGLFTAPTTDGPVTITATSVADPSKTATATVTVQAFGGLVISPTGAALGFGQSRVFSVVAGAGPYTWGTDAQAGTISTAGVFTAGFTEGEFFLGVTSPTGSAIARVIVDRWAGIYDGTVTRNTVASTRTWSVGRYFNPAGAAQCTSTGLPCYFTGSIDFGSAALTACYFQPISFGSDAVQGSCDYSASSFPLGLSGTLNGTGLALTARSADGTLVITFGMTKR